MEHGDDIAGEHQEKHDDERRHDDEVAIFISLYPLNSPPFFQLLTVNAHAPCLFTKTLALICMLCLSSLVTMIVNICLVSVLILNLVEAKWFL